MASPEHPGRILRHGEAKGIPGGACTTAIGTKKYTKMLADMAGVEDLTTLEGSET